MPDLTDELNGFPDRLAQVITRTTSGNLTAFCRKAEIPVSTMKDYLDGRYYPGLATLLRIAKTAGISLDVLAKGEPEERSSVSLTPRQQLELLTESLRVAHRLYELPPASQLKYRERILYLETLLRHLVMDAESYLAELREKTERRRLLNR